jgi:hypothetical protein
LPDGEKNKHWAHLNETMLKMDCQKVSGKAEAKKISDFDGDILMHLWNTFRDMEFDESVKNFLTKRIENGFRRPNDDRVCLEC